MAWSAALVLISGITVVAAGVVDTRVPAIAAETPALVLLAPTAVPTAQPLPKPVVRTQVMHRARSGVPIETSLGPPPGPQNDAVPTRFAAPADRYAYLVGIADYPSPTHKTIGGANDVRFIRDSLLAAGWLPQNIRIETDRQTSGASVRAGLRWLATKGQPGTFTLFHYSGHVNQVGNTEMLWPADRDFVRDTEVAALLSQVRGKLWMDIAGCEAAGFAEGLPSSRVLVTASSRSDQKSYEYPQWGESVWTGLLWDLGLGQGQADANANGVTTVGEALRYATYYAQAITLRQAPYGRQTPQVFGDPVRGWTLDNPPA